MHLKLIIITSFLASTSLLSVLALEPTGTSTNNGKKYYYFRHDGDANQAKSICNSRDQDLVTISNVDENQFIYTLFDENKPDLWIGIKTEDGLNWNWWDSGDSASYTNFCSGEGSGQRPNEFCGGMTSYRNGCWEDWPCSLNKGGFVCQDREGSLGGFAIPKGGFTIRGKINLFGLGAWEIILTLKSPFSG